MILAQRRMSVSAPVRSHQLVNSDLNSNMRLEVVYNNCYGGFGLSEEAARECMNAGINSGDPPIYDPRFVDIVRRLGPAVNDTYSKLAIETIDTDDYPGFTGIYIHEYDGLEEVRVKTNPLLVKLARIVRENEDDTGPVAVAVREILAKNEADIAEVYGKYACDEPLASQEQ